MQHWWPVPVPQPRGHLAPQPLSRNSVSVDAGHWDMTVLSTTWPDLMARERLSVPPEVYFERVRKQLPHCNSRILPKSAKTLCSQRGQKQRTLCCPPSANTIPVSATKSATGKLEKPLQESWRSRYRHQTTPVYNPFMPWTHGPSKTGQYLTRKNIKLKVSIIIGIHWLVSWRAVSCNQCAIRKETLLEHYIK